MLSMTFIIEDLLIISNNVEGTQDGPWKTLLVSFEERHELPLTSEQLGAILFLAIAGDEHKLSRELYEIAEPAITGIPHNLRPVP